MVPSQVQIRILRSIPAIVSPNLFPVRSLAEAGKRLNMLRSQIELHTRGLTVQMMARNRGQRKGRLDLPPGYELVVAREHADAFVQAQTIAGERGAGTLVWVSRYDLVEFAVVLEPEEVLSQARRAFFAGMNALCDALSTHSPPEKGITISWPGTIRLDEGLIGGGQLAWPEGCGEDEVPDWLVFGGMLRSVDLAHIEQGLNPHATSLVSEGIELVDTDAIVESFARHLLSAFESWREFGFRPVGETYLERLPTEKAGSKRLIDSNGDLLVQMPHKGAPVERRDLLAGLALRDWYDPAYRTPKLK